MTIAVDLDGTITRHPKELGMLMDALDRQGHDVWIVSAVPDGESIEVRQKMLLNAGLATWNARLIRVRDDGKQKAIWCRDNGVDILIDDASNNMQGAREIYPRMVRLQVV